MEGERTVEEAKLALDLAKLDLALAEAREQFGDDRITLQDVMAIRRTARHFAVTQMAAYHRAKSLECLSYQTARPAPSSTETTR